ncbi:MAG: hypothetical protein A3J47_03780 [Candidatus Yanofskybacteria bacterium RIFCSPHIGHO2_02_FULL_43_22]|uniref:HTH psq-type domain-containing protein n=1 Tax=Candidatus Yanofskybacteria bacterium RIFCSPHIGHO2_02_FULL_43_22 TaxID=1802681 RepID=A0A1F8FL82_9BACT|nr:MAG: hypothetical protein A3J47_03780 [Candidatus Yanofskybacteria bacterium RIFCSPHIGHO2_02_FULL_43_22]
MEFRKDYQAARSLRLEGKTYGEIRGIFKIPKSTLSGWFSGLKINNKAKKILESKKKNGYYKLVEFNKTRTRDILKENENIRKEYEFRVGKLNNRELMILGAALYWGEGYKNFNQKRPIYPYLCLGNSDSEMIITFIYFLEKILGITKDRIRAPIFIYPGIVPEEAINYWQKLTKIPRENFRCQMALNRASQGERPKNLLPHGTLQLRVIKRQDFFKIRGLIDGIIKSL